MRNMEAVIRRVRIGDEAALAYVQTESWKAAFAHILEPDVLAKNTDLQRSTAMYQRLLEGNIGNGKRRQKKWGRQKEGGQKEQGRQKEGGKAGFLEYLL